MISLIGQTRKCPTCLIEGVVVRINARMNATSMVTLDCAHSCNVPNNPPSWATTANDGHQGDVMTRRNRPAPLTPRPGFLAKLCACCDTSYETVWTGAIGDVCIACRDIFAIRNDAEATLLIDMMDALSPTQRATRITEETQAWVAGGKRHTPMDSNHRGLVPLPGQRQATGPTEKADPVKVAAAVRSMVDYGQISDTFVPDPDKPTSFVIAANGLFEVRTTPYATITLLVTGPADATSKVKSTPIPGVTVAYTPGVKLNLPKLPWEFLRQTMAFFRETCVRQGGSSEAIVQLWWDRSIDPATGQVAGHFIHVPEHCVSGASVNHDGRFDEQCEQLPPAADGTEQGGRYIYIGDIHSHGSSMSGFWSGVDDGDENRKSEGQVFGVIGKVNEPFPSWKWRMKVRGGYITLAISDIFDVATQTIPFTVTTDVLLDAASIDANIVNGKVSLHCPVDLFSDVTCPAEWHTKVTGSRGRGSVHHMGSHTTTDHRRIGPLRQYLYIANGDELEEFEIDGPVRRPTGRKAPLKSIDHPSGN